MFRNCQRFRRIELMSRGRQIIFPRFLKQRITLKIVDQDHAKKGAQIYYRMEEATGRLNEALCSL